MNATIFSSVQFSSVQFSPLLSVIIPTYNRKEMLSEALDGILNQSVRDIEVIVVDDRSTDGTQNFVNGLNDERVRYYLNAENKGSEMSRNFGLKQAHGKYVVFHDDDDYYTDYEFFAKALKVFAGNAGSEPPLVMVCADGKMLVTETGKIIPHTPGNPGMVKGVDFILDEEYHKPLSLFPTVFDAEILRRSGFENMKVYDSETYYFAALQGNVYIMPDIIGIYRLHPESNTLGRKRSSEWMKKRMENLAGRIEITHIILQRLYEISSRSQANKWYAHAMVGTVYFFNSGSTGFTDRVRIYTHILKDSKIVPELWLILTKNFIRGSLRLITPLRKLYRFVKYRCRGKPYPED